MKTSKINFFEKYLTLWVLICMLIGVLIGQNFANVVNLLNNFEYANVSIPIAILIWIMIFPMMIKIDFKSIKQVKNQPKGLYLTWIINWLVKPFTMLIFAYFFFEVLYSSLISSELAKDYLSGAILLGAAPCTAMVFVWSQLTNGNPAYTLVQVATNDLIILIAYIPIVKLLLNISSVTVPWDTLILSVVIFVLVPLVLGFVTRNFIVKNKGQIYLDEKFIPKFNNVTIVGLLCTLILIFTIQSNLILNNPFDIILIAIPLIIQTVFIFSITLLTAKKLKLKFDIAAPASMIGASNFFELSIAVAIAVFGANSAVALATTVGLLVEVPVMLLLVKFINKNKKWYNKGVVNEI